MMAGALKYAEGYHDRRCNHMLHKSMQEMPNWDHHARNAMETPPLSIHNDHMSPIRNSVWRRLRLDPLHVDWTILLQHLE